MVTPTDRSITWMAEAPGNGFGDAAAEYLDGLRAAGVAVTWTPMAWAGDVWGHPASLAPLTCPPPGSVHDDIVGLTMDSDVTVVHGPPLWSPHLTGAPTRLVACTAWEADAMPRDRVDLLNRYRAVVVPSRFNRDVLAESGVRVPIAVVPHIVCAPSARRGLRLPGTTTDTFVVSAIGTWTTRKAMDETVLAYLDAFTGDDDVLLVVKTTRHDHQELALPRDRPPTSRTFSTALTVARLLAGRRNPPRLSLMTEEWSRSTVEALHHRADCHLSLSRGEAWGLTTSDAVAHGTPVVVTGWGGGPEILPSDYPYLVEYDLIPTDHDRADNWIHLAPDRRWARARHDHAVQLLRHVFDARDDARCWAKKAQDHVARHFGRDLVTAGLRATLESVAR